MLHDQGISTIANAVSASVGTTVFAVFAVLDPSIATIALAVIGAVVVFLPLWFKYKTDTKLDNLKIELEKKLAAQAIEIKEVKVTSDGMKDALVKAAASESLARGTLAGMEQAEARAAVKSAAVAEGRAQVAQGGHGGTHAASQPPQLLPSQVQPVAAAAVEGVELTEEQINKMIHELNEQARKLRLKPEISKAE